MHRPPRAPSAAPEATPSEHGAADGSGPDAGDGAVAALVARARDGDRAAFGELYGTFAPMVHAILIGRVARRVDVEDLAQEVFLAAWRGLGGLRSDAHVGGWLAVIARHAADRFHARARPRPEPIPETLPDGRAADGARVAEGAEVLELLRALPEAYRDTLAMRLVEGMSGPVIARATGLAPDSVRTNLSRGMRQLREALRRRGWR